MAQSDPEFIWYVQKFNLDDPNKNGIINAYKKIDEYIELKEHYQNKINKLYKNVNFLNIPETCDKIAKYEKLYENLNYFATIRKLREEIELRKVPIFIQQAKSYLLEGKSVIIFVNYQKTCNVLSNELNTKCMHEYTYTHYQIKNIINSFQSNKEKIFICSIRFAFQGGIMLNDIHGEYPRVVLISGYPGYNALQQILRRTTRFGTKSSVLQKIIFADGVEQEEISMNKIYEDIERMSNIEKIFKEAIF